MTPIKKWIANLLLIIIPPVLIFGTAEISIRLFAQKRIKTYFDGQAEQWLGNPVPAKAPGEYRIFVFGGSSAYGFPVGARYSIASWLKKSFPYLLPDRKISVVNCGWPGKASHQVLEGVRYSLKFKPDLYILYDGHNEAPIANRLYVDHPLYKMDLELYYKSALYRFLTVQVDRLRKKIIYGHSGHVETNYREDLIAEKIYKHVEVTDEDYAKILATYRKNTETAIRFAHKHGIEVLMITPPSNLHDIPPFASMHGRSLSETESSAWNASYEQGKKAQAAGDWNSALTIYQAAEKIDPSFAELQYRLGQAYESLNRSAEAHTAFIKARDFDARPWRAKSSLIETAKELAGMYGLLFVDGDKLFQQLSKNGVVAKDLVSDDVHPTIEGQQILTSAILRELASHDKIEPRSRWQWAKLEAARAADPEKEWKVDGSDNAYHHVLTGLLLWEQKRYPEAITKLEKGLELMPQFLESEAFLGDAYYRTGSIEKARAAFKELETKDPSLYQILKGKYPDVGESLSKIGSQDSSPAVPAGK